MFNCHLRIAGHERSPLLFAKDFTNSVSFALLILDGFSCATPWYFDAIAFGSDNAELPSLHLHHSDGQFFAQIFAHKSWAPRGSEGWYTVGTHALNNGNADLLMFPDDGQDTKGYFRDYSADGLYFARNYLVTKDAVQQALSECIGKPSADWFRNGLWTNFGIL